MLLYREMVDGEEFKWALASLSVTRNPAVIPASGASQTD
jgi:hypothetical protein